MLPMRNVRGDAVAGVQTRWPLREDHLRPGLLRFDDERTRVRVQRRRDGRSKKSRLAGYLSSDFGIAPCLLDQPALGTSVEPKAHSTTVQSPLLSLKRSASP